MTPFALARITATITIVIGTTYISALPSSPGKMKLDTVSVPSNLILEQTIRSQWWCKKGDSTVCSQAELRNPTDYQQVIIVGTGYDKDEYTKFQGDFDSLLAGMNRRHGTYPQRYQHSILYIGLWTPGAKLAPSPANPLARFAARVLEHPARAGALLTLDSEKLHKDVEKSCAQYALSCAPLSLVVLYNTDDHVTASAVPPTFSSRSYGIARVGRQNLSQHVVRHEIGHSAFNFLDEYYEQSLRDVSINTIDVLTPLLQFNWTWSGAQQALENALGIYDIDISEILANNGSDNISTSRYPATATPPGYTPDRFPHEGGMFFGRGVFRETFNSFMRSSDRGESPAHQRIIRQALKNTPPPRANDRIRIAGPYNGYPFGFGGSTRVLLFDADKHHRWHPTTQYQVQVGWYSYSYRWCGFFKICRDSRWNSAQKSFTPTRRTLDLAISALGGLTNVAQSILCGLHDNMQIGQFRICTMSAEEFANAALPALALPIPYQDAVVPTTSRFKTYYWRFRSDNGTIRSKWTSWSSFYRSL